MSFGRAVEWLLPARVLWCLLLTVISSLCTQVDAASADLVTVITVHFMVPALIYLYFQFISMLWRLCFPPCVAEAFCSVVMEVG
jgi:hypothetical protein